MQEDALNAAQLFAKIVSEPELKLNEIYSNAKSEKEEHLSFSMGDLLSKIDLKMGRA